MNKPVAFHTESTRGNADHAWRQRHSSSPSMYAVRLLARFPRRKVVVYTYLISADRDSLLRLLKDRDNG
jgi:hypothetical protein